MNTTSNNSTSSNNGGQGTTTAVMAIIDSLEMAKVVDSRIVQISLGGLSTVMAMIVIWRIWRDSWRSLKLNAREEKFAWLYQVHPAESFPLILGFSIFLQQILFITIQATTLNYFTVLDCKDTGIFIIPGVMGISYLHLVFGLEMTFRALQRSPFSKRFFFAPLVNVVFVWILFIVTIVVCKITGYDAQKCYGGIVFLGGSLGLNNAVIGLISGITFVLLVMAFIIFRQLVRTVHLDPNERVGASRMVYYLLLAACINVFLLPYFIKQSTKTSNGSIFVAANVAEYALFISGAIIAMLHLFLRANAARMAIKAKETPWHAKRRFRFFGPSELEIINISPPLNLVNPNYRPDEKVSEIYSRRFWSHQRKTSFPLSNPMMNYPNSPRPINTSAARHPIQLRRPSIATETTVQGSSPAVPTPPPNHRKSSVYTLWPGTEDSRHPQTLQSTILPPPKLPPSTPLPQIPTSVYATKNPVRAHTASRPITRTGPIATSSTDPVPMVGPNTTDVNDFASQQAKSRLQPPSLPWALNRGVSMESSLSGTVPIGVRLSTAPNARISTTPGNSAMPSRLVSTIDFGQTRASKAGAPFDESFSQAFQEQTRDARGRDLNSFRWIDSPTDGIVEPDDLTQEEEQEQVPKSSKRKSINPDISENSSMSRYSGTSIQQSPRFRQENGGQNVSPWI